MQGMQIKTTKKKKNLFLFIMRITSLLKSKILFQVDMEVSQDFHNRPKICSRKIIEIRVLLIVEQLITLEPFLLHLQKNSSLGKPKVIVNWMIRKTA